MDTFGGNIIDVFNIRGRGTIILIDWNGKGNVSPGDHLLTKNGRLLRINTVERSGFPRNPKIGLGISIDFDKALKLKNQFVFKQPR